MIILFIPLQFFVFRIILLSFEPHPHQLQDRKEEVARNVFVVKKDFATFAVAVDGLKREIRRRGGELEVVLVSQSPQSVRSHFIL